MSIYSKYLILVCAESEPIKLRSSIDVLSGKFQLLWRLIALFEAGGKERQEDRSCNSYFVTQKASSASVGVSELVGQLCNTGFMKSSKLTTSNGLLTLW